MWILQEVMDTVSNTRANYLRYRNALDEMGIDYKVLRYSSEGRLELLDEDFVVDEESSEKLKVLFSEPFLAIGSVKFHEDISHLKAYRLAPDFIIDFNNIEGVIPKSELLNPPSESEVGTLQELVESNRIPYRSHIRLLSIDKTLNGDVYLRTQIHEIPENAKEGNNTRLLQAELMVSPLKDIDSEYRFFIIGGEIVAYSGYVNSNGDVDWGTPAGDDVVEYARIILSRYSIPNNTVMDIAKMRDNSFKVIEFNEIIASGIYESDIKAIITASENYS